MPNFQFARACGLLLLLAAAFVILMPIVDGQSVDSKGSCSRIRIMAAANSFRTFSVWANENDNTGGLNTCTSGVSKNPFEVEVGKSIGFNCLETSGGPLPPGTPDTNGIIITGKLDNDGFPDAGTARWTQTFSSCVVQQSFTVYCTTNGANGGTATWGMFRISIRVVDTSLPTTYDDSSESANAPSDGFYGMYRCNPHEESVTNHKGSLGASPFVYEGDNRLFSNWTLNASTLATGNSVSNRVKCGAGNGFQTLQAATTTSLNTGAITITVPNFQEGCLIVQNLSIVRFASLSGWSTERFGKFQTGLELSSGCVIQNNSGDMECSTGKSVTYHWTWDGINITKSDSDSADNESSFTISLHQEFIRPKGLRNATGILVSGASATCARLDPNSILGGSISHGTTDANGNANRVEYAVASPIGFWYVTCSGSLNGNFAQYTIRFAHATSFTANTGGAISVNITLNESNPNLFNINATMVLRAFDPITGTILLAVPDFPNNIRITVFGFNRTTDTYNDLVVDNGIMTQLDGVSSAWWYNFTASKLNITGAAIYANFNLTGNPYLVSQGYHFNWSIASDTVTVGESVPTIWDLPNGIIFIGLFGVLLAYVTPKNNPIPAFAGMIAQLLGMYLTYTNSGDFTEDNLNMFLLFFAICFLGCMVRAYVTVNVKENI
jgi:hypothetical protein